MIISDCRRIVGGKAEGRTLVTRQPINFLSMVDIATGKITDIKHDLHGKSLKGTVLVFPNAIGSSVGAYVIYSLKERDNAPLAMICSKADITTASGCAIAEIPVVDLPVGAEITMLSDGVLAMVDATQERATVKI